MKYMLTFTPLITLQLGPIQLATHGVLFAAGFLVAFLLVVRAAKRQGLRSEIVESLALIALLGGLVGARLAFILVEGRGMSWVEMLQVWHGGLSSHGGYIFGFSAALIYAIYKKIPIAKYADLMFPYMLLGWAIGRIGCLNALGEWGWALDHDSWLAFVIYGVRRYPTSLFETLAYLAGFFIILGLRKYTRFGNFSLVPAALSVFLFTLSRFLIDFLREYSLQYAIFSQTVTAVLVFLSLTVLTWQFMMYRKQMMR